MENCNWNKIYGEKSIPMIALWCPTFIIMADSETLHTIIAIILIIYFSYFLEVHVEH